MDISRDMSRVILDANLFSPLYLRIAMQILLWDFLKTIQRDALSHVI